MACGVPVIASDSSSHPEVVENVGALVPPDDPHQIATSLEKLLKSTSLRKAYRLKGLKWSAKFTWEKTATKTLNIIKSFD